MCHLACVQPLMRDPPLSLPLIPLTRGGGDWFGGDLTSQLYYLCMFFLMGFEGLFAPNSALLCAYF